MENFKAKAIAMTGRPSKYDPAFCETARKLCRLGAIDIEIADFLGVNVATLYRWKNDHVDFCEALKEAKAEADERVKASLYHKAIGYSYDAVKIFQVEGVPLIVPYREHVPPSDTACIFWLKNRQPEMWREQTRQPGDSPDNPLHAETRIANPGDVGEIVTRFQSAGAKLTNGAVRH